MARRAAVVLLTLGALWAASACDDQLVVGPTVYVQNASASVYLVTALSANDGRRWTYRVGPTSAGVMGMPSGVYKVEVQDPTDCRVVASGVAQGPWQNVGMFRVTIDASSNVNIVAGPRATDIPNAALDEVSDCPAG